MQVQAQVQLKNLNTLNLSAIASHYVQINHPDDVIEALNFAEQHNLNALILSGGSNVLLPQQIQALVLHLNIQGINVLAEDENTITVKVGAGQVMNCVIGNGGGGNAAINGPGGTGGTTSVSRGGIVLCTANGGKGGDGASGGYGGIIS